MKKAVAVMAALVAFAVNVFATDIIGFAATKEGKVPFPHKVHQMILKDCRKCHTNPPGKIQGFGKIWAHKTCTGCHKKMKKGPIICKDCHEK